MSKLIFLCGFTPLNQDAVFGKISFFMTAHEREKAIVSEERYEL
jgi:hypothetical protein